MKLQPITLPPGWTAERDCAHFEDCWGPEPNYAEALRYYLHFHHAEFANAVLLSVHCFLRRGASLLAFEPECLTTAEQIALLQRIVQSHAYAGNQRAALLGCLHACAFVEAERARVLAVHQQAGEHAWMYPLSQLAGWLRDHAAKLEEHMGGEDLGYDAIKRKVELGVFCPDCKEKLGDFLRGAAD